VDPYGRSLTRKQKRGVWEIIDAAQELPSDEESGEHLAPSLGVGLKVAMSLRDAAGETDEPDDERGERADQQENLQPCGGEATRVSKAEAPSMALQVTERLLDLHSLAVELLDASLAADLVGQRRCQ
jgi:hypothetical protein